MEIIQRLRSMAKIVLTRLELHGQLVRVEWAEERHRLQQLLVVGLLGFIFLLCALLFVGIFAIALSWTSGYRIYTIAGILALYSAGFVLCVHRVSQLAQQSSATFAVTREEIAADLALIRSQL